MKKNQKTISPIFCFLELINANTLAVLPNIKTNMQKTKTSEEKGAKQFYLIPLSISQPSIDIDGELYLIRENHISVYQHYEDDDEKMFGMTAFHYTATLHRQGCKATLHTFYDMYGVYKGYHVALIRKGEKISITVNNELPIKVLSGMQILPVINEIGSEFNSYVSQQENEIDSLSKQVCDQSRLIFKPEQEPLLEGKSFDLYIRLVESYAQKVEALNRFIFSPNFALPKLLRDTLGNLMSKKKAKEQDATPKTTVVRNAGEKSKATVSKKQPIENVKFESVVQIETHAISEDQPVVEQKISTEEELEVSHVKNRKKKHNNKSNKSFQPLSDFVRLSLTELETLRAKEKANDPAIIVRRCELLQECITLSDSRQMMLMVELSAERQQVVSHARGLIDIFSGLDKIEEIKQLMTVVKEASAKSIIMSALFGKIDNLKFLLQYFKRSIDLNHNNIPLLCCEKLPFDTLEILLRSGANPNVVSFVGMTPIMIAAGEGNAKKIEILVRYGANINYQLRKPSFLLVQTKPHPEASKYIDALKSLSQTPDGLTTPLFFAVSSEKIEAVKQLVHLGSNLELLDHLGFSAYSIAASVSNSRRPLTENRKHILRYFYTECGCDINKLFGLPNKKQTVLHFAVQFREADYVNYLLELGADPNIIRDKDERESYCINPLILSVIREFDDVTEIIIKKTKVPLSFSTLLFAYLHGKAIKIKQLAFETLVKNLNANSKEGINTQIKIKEFEQTLLHWLIGTDDIENLKVCLNNGADPNLLRNDGISCLGVAIGIGNTEIVELFLKNKTKPITPETLLDTRKYTCPKNQLEINALLDAYEEKLLGNAFQQFFI